MSLRLSFRHARALSRRVAILPALGLVLALSLGFAAAAPPAWWATRGIVDNNAAADDFAAANVGQLKTLAKKAADEMDTVLPGGGAGTALHALVTTWQQPPASGVTRDDFAALNVGQAKSVAKLFYDRLAVFGAGTSGVYPWTGAAADDYALVNVGQLKTLFAFAVPHDSGLDSDGDGLTDMAERGFGQGLNPLDPDTDDDLLLDNEEIQYGLNPSVNETTTLPSVVFDAQNQLLASGGETFVIDADGNLIGKN